MESDPSISLYVEILFGTSNKSMYTRYNKNAGSNTTEVGLNSYNGRNNYFSVKKVEYIKAALMDKNNEPVDFVAVITNKTTDEEYYMGNQGGLLLRLAIDQGTDLVDVGLTNAASGCNYVAPASAIKKHMSEYFINVGELKCSK